MHSIKNTGSIYVWVLIESYWKVKCAGISKIFAQAIASK
jgi:hypothetical protein